MLDKNFFDEQMRVFIDYLNRRFPGKCTVTIQDNEMYYKNVQHFDNIKFTKLMKYLYDSWQYGHFPLIADFNRIKKELFGGELPEYKPEPRIENVDAITKQKEWRKVIEGIKLLSEISDIVVKKKVGARFHSMGECEKKDVWVPFCKQILAAGMLWDKQAKRFVDRVEPIPEHCFDLRGMYPK